MGLDMWLNKRSKNLDVAPEEVCYWRKANQIHNWFVNKVQEGNDDCGEYVVTKEELQELVDLCQEVIDASKLVEGSIINGRTYDRATSKWIDNVVKSKIIKNPKKAMELLPTVSGFFFGSTDYDEYYILDLQHTVEVLKDVIKDTDFDKYVITYNSSW